MQIQSHPISKIECSYTVSEDTKGFNLTKFQPLGPKYSHPVQD